MNGKPKQEQRISNTAGKTRRYFPGLFVQFTRAVYTEMLPLCSLASSPLQALASSQLLQGVGRSKAGRS